MPDTEKIHTFGETECAVCIMEDIIDRTHQQRVPEALAAQIEAFGHSAIRYFVISRVAPLVQKMMDLSYEDDLLDEWSFDWEVIPTVVSVLDWSKFDGYRDEFDWMPTPKALLDQVYQDLNGTITPKPKKPSKGRQLNI